MQFKQSFKTLAVGLLVTVLAPTLGAAADASWPVYLNGAKTSLTATVLEDGTVLAPMTIPVGPNKQDYDLSVQADAQAHRVNITRKPRTLKVRGDEKCYHCSGTGKCQQCYPAGSGLNVAGTSCVVCSATGHCWYCEGTGDKKW